MKALTIGIGATNLRRGGGVTHLNRTIGRYLASTPGNTRQGPVTLGQPAIVDPQIPFTLGKF